MNKKITAVLNSRKPVTVMAAVFLCALLNSLLNMAGEKAGIPLFLDSIFTAVAAALFGIIPGVLTGLFSNLIQEVFRGFPGMVYPFAPVNMATGLIVGILVKKGYFESIFRVLLVIFYTTLANALLGALIVTLVFGGITHEDVDSIVTVILMTGQSMFSSAFIARIFINLVDKGIAVLVAYWIFISPPLSRVKFIK